MIINNRQIGIVAYFTFTLLKIKTIVNIVSLSRASWVVYDIFYVMYDSVIVFYFVRKILSKLTVLPSREYAKLERA